MGSRHVTTQPVPVGSPMPSCQAPLRAPAGGPAHPTLALGLRLNASNHPLLSLLHPCPASRQMVPLLSLGGPVVQLLALSYARGVWHHHTLAVWPRMRPFPSLSLTHGQTNVTSLSSLQLSEPFSGSTSYIDPTNNAGDPIQRGHVTVKATQLECGRAEGYTPR